MSHIYKPHTCSKQKKCFKIDKKEPCKNPCDFMFGLPGFPGPPGTGGGATGDVQYPIDTFQPLFIAPQWNVNYGPPFYTNLQTALDTLETQPISTFFLYPGIYNNGFINPFNVPDFASLTIINDNGRITSPFIAENVNYLSIEGGIFNTVNISFNPASIMATHKIVKIIDSQISGLTIINDNDSEIPNIIYIHNCALSGLTITGTSNNTLIVVSNNYNIRNLDEGEYNILISGTANNVQISDNRIVILNLTSNSDTGTYINLLSNYINIINYEPNEEQFISIGNNIAGQFNINNSVVVPSTGFSPFNIQSSFVNSLTVTGTSRQLIITNSFLNEPFGNLTFNNSYIVSNNEQFGSCDFYNCIVALISGATNIRSTQSLIMAFESIDDSAFFNSIVAAPELNTIYTVNSTLLGVSGGVAPVLDTPVIIIDSEIRNSTFIANFQDDNLVYSSVSTTGYQVSSGETIFENMTIGDITGAGAANYNLIASDTFTTTGGVATVTIINLGNYINFATTDYQVIVIPHAPMMCYTNNKTTSSFDILAYSDSTTPVPDGNYTFDIYVTFPPII